MRSWLEKNKIVFETVTATLLSFMAIVVSVGQMLVSCQQAKLSELQTKVAEAQALPQFVCRIFQEFDTTSGKFIHDHLIVSNNGGFVSELDASTAAYLIVTLTEGAHQMKAELPINGYFNAVLISHEGTGELVKFNGFHNTDKQVEIERTVRELMNQSNGFANVELRLGVN